MYRILIVDDDQFIRAGIEHIIDWEKLGVTIVGSAGNGNEAMRLYQRYKPDIVLTDIRMPEMDGISFIKSICQSGGTALIIVLSGYDDYTYLRAALKYNVEDYLLKPADRLELEEIVRTCCAKLGSSKRAKPMNTESIQIIKNNIFLRMIENRIQPAQLRDKLSFLCVDIAERPYYQIALISWRNEQEKEIDHAEAQYRSFAILNSMDFELQQAGRGHAFLDAYDRVVCLLAGEGGSRDGWAEDNATWLLSTGAAFSTILKTPWYCTLGTPVNDLGHISVSFTEAAQAQERISRTGPAQCVSHSVKNDWSFEAGQSGTMLIPHVKQYIHEHYQSELSLQLLSEHFYISGSYLGKRFKEETGVPFNEYLNDLRIDKAKRLLHGYHNKVSDIAYLVGFTDSNYFFRKFKQLCGMSPTQYREMTALRESLPSESKPREC